MKHPSASTAAPGPRSGRASWRPRTRPLRSLLMLVCLLVLVTTDTSIGQDDAQTNAQPNAQPETQAATAPLGPGAVAGPGRLNNLAVITIEGPMNAVTSQSFERRLNEAIDAGADGIVVEIDTPGGELGAVLEITGLIKQVSVPTIAWINDAAYSGGAITALACDEIVIAPTATFGDAAPIIPGIANLGMTERAKALSPLIAEVVDSAIRNGYDEVLVTSMVVENVETWLVEHNDTGKRYFLTEREYRGLFGEDPERVTPIVSTSGVSLGALGPAPPVTPLPFSTPAPRQADPNAPAVPVEEATLPDDAAPALRALADVAPESSVASAAPSIASLPTRPDFAQEDASDYTFIQYATDGSTLLTLTEPGLRALGFTRYTGTISTDEELKNYVAAQTLVRLDQSWSEDLVEFTSTGMSGMVFRGICVVVFLLCLFIEISMPGVGIAGLIALVALAGLILPRMLIDASGWWTVVAILLGVGLIAVELLVFPGFGVPGIAGFMLMVVGLIGAFSNPGELFPGSGPGNDSNLGWAIATVFLGLFGAGVGVYFFSKYTKSIPIARNLMLNTTLATYDTGAKVGMLAAMDAAPAVALRPGDEGLTTTALRPEGEAEFGGELYDVTFADGWVDRNTKVRVVAVVGNRVTVEPVDRAPNTHPAGEDLA